MNPSSFVGEPDMFPGGDNASLGMWLLLLFAIAMYVGLIWLFSNGPAQWWAKKNEGLTIAIIYFWPVPFFLLYMLFK